MENEQLEIQRHSAAHLLAAAVQALYPKAKFGVGPVIENGFYYDIDFGDNISEEDLKEIEKKAKHLTKQNLKFEREEVKLEDVEIGLESMIDKYGLQKIIDTVSRMSASKKD